jgi:hypothetical protein
MAVDGRGNLYVAQFPGTVVRISPDGQTTPVTGSNIPGENQPENGEPALSATLGPSSIAVDAAGKLLHCRPDRPEHLGSEPVRQNSFQICGSQCHLAGRGRR